MDPLVFTDIARSIADASLNGHSEGEILGDFCANLNKAGIPVKRALLGPDTLHPAARSRPRASANGAKARSTIWKTAPIRITASASSATTATIRFRS